MQFSVQRKLIIFLNWKFATDSTGKVTDHRITGQFRNKSSRIWDPHPQYLIDAFGLHLHLLLYQDGNFIPNDMKVKFLQFKWHFRIDIEFYEIDVLFLGCCMVGSIRSFIWAKMKQFTKRKKIKILNGCKAVSIADMLEEMIIR